MLYPLRHSNNITINIDNGEIDYTDKIGTNYTEPLN